MSEDPSKGSLVRVSRTTETKQFPNGDTYAGGWVNALPDGEGVYKWADGSEYSGDWLKGQKHGVGRYRWPSGATYQGCLLYTSPSPRDRQKSRMPSSA